MRFLYRLKPSVVRQAERADSQQDPSCLGFGFWRGEKMRAISFERIGPLMLLLERVTGIEPAWPAWKAGALPLSYTRKGVFGARRPRNRG
jgi:hypothetical protein